MTAASKGPLNYTTTVDPGRTAIECIHILVKHGATNVALSVGEDKVPDGLDFIIVTPWGPRQYALPVNLTGTEKALWKAYQQGRIRRQYAGAAQARRVAWRVLKDWLEAQLALVDAGVSELPQVMLPWMRVAVGQTLYEAVAENEMKALGQ
jgi:hypothetical protein